MFTGEFPQCMRMIVLVVLKRLETLTHAIQKTKAGFHDSEPLFSEFNPSHHN
jgi:hypothetical protein